VTRAKNRAGRTPETAQGISGFPEGSDDQQPSHDCETTFKPPQGETAEAGPPQSLDIQWELKVHRDPQ